MLELDQACLQPGGQAFDHTFRPGGMTVVLGPNQSGKTNLCRLVAGLTSNAAGRVLLDGEDLGPQSPAQRPVAMVYQAFVNYPNLTVADNIASPMVAAGIKRAERGPRVRALAAALQIDDLLQRLPAELSGGQQQRLAIARALAKQARVLLLDEPLVNLDFKLREALEVELRELLRDGQTTVIYTSSDPRDAFNLADELLLLSGGEKLQAGPPLQVYEQPDNAAAMHLLSDPGTNLFARHGARCGVRPEHLVLEPPEQDCLRFTLQVHAVETSGDETFVHGRVAADAASDDWVVRLTGMTTLGAGQAVDVYARRQDIREFADGAG